MTVPKVSNADVVAKLDAMFSYQDHEAADDLLIEWIAANGGQDVADAYNRLIVRATNWWYS